MTVRWRFLSVVCFSLALAGGCTIDRLQRSEAEDEQRVQTAQAALAAEQERSTGLARQKEQLAADLSEHELTLSDLNGRIERLRSANAGAAANTEAKRRERDRLKASLLENSAQLQALKRNKDDTSQQKLDRIEYLKRQIRQQLDLLLR